MGIPMQFFYDTEFVEDGTTIDLISIGIVSENGDEFYRVSSQFDRVKASDHEFVRKHVLPYIPGDWQPSAFGQSVFRPDLDDPSVASREEIGVDLIRWMWELSTKGRYDHTDEVELWANYGAYDHICLMQLWGPMMTKPPILPMFTHDLQQRIGLLDVPKSDIDEIEVVGQQHNALDDAKWNKAVSEYLDDHYAIDYWRKA